MNERISDMNIPRTCCVTRPMPEMALHEVGRALVAIIKAIALATKRSARLLWQNIKRGFKFILKKLDEGAEIHNRMRYQADERYPINHFHIR